MKERRYTDVVNLWKKLKPEEVTSKITAFALTAMSELNMTSDLTQLVDQILAQLRLAADSTSYNTTGTASFYNFGTLTGAIRRLGDQHRMDEVFELVRRIPGLNITAAMTIDLFKLKGGFQGSYKTKSSRTNTARDTSIESFTTSEDTSTDPMTLNHHNQVALDEKAEALLALFKKLVIESPELLAQDSVLATVCNQLTASGNTLNRFLEFIEEKECPIGPALLLSLASAFASPYKLFSASFKDRLLDYAQKHSIKLTDGILLQLMIGLKLRHQYDEAIKLYETETVVPDLKQSFQLALSTQAMILFHQVKDFDRVFQIYKQAVPLESYKHEATVCLLSLAFDVEAHRMMKTSPKTYSYIKTDASVSHKKQQKLFARCVGDTLSEALKAGQLDNASVSLLCSILGLHVRNRQFVQAKEIFEFVLRKPEEPSSQKELYFPIQYLYAARFSSSQSEAIGELVKKAKDLNRTSTRRQALGIVGEILDIFITAPPKSSTAPPKATSPLNDS
jgi:hypothetical protein